MLEFLPSEEDKKVLENGDMSVYSDFCKLNPYGLKGEGYEKYGFITGPSVFKTTNKNDPEEMKTYELYAPTIYIKDDSMSEEYIPYKLIIARFNLMTFVYLMKDGELEEYDYTLLYERSHAAAEQLSKKIEPVIDFYISNYLRNDSKVKFFYMNKANLAVKYSPSIKKDMLNTDLRHYWNVISEKFSSNETLEEYKITTTKYWMVGVRSVGRLVIIMLPSTMSQENVEDEKTRIIERYFSQFIF